MKATLAIAGAASVNIRNDPKASTPFYGNYVFRWRIGIVFHGLQYCRIGRNIIRAENRSVNLGLCIQSNAIHDLYLSRYIFEKTMPPSRVSRNESRLDG
ncbi:MAG: hypothetical protein LBV45_00180 [Xanthomonadaceae bacterium]|jgi:hypothetical protein|nr:hypothetical protein [Xanthomonadaceae bacterium]